MSICPSCWEENAEGARFCSTCGAALTRPSASAEVRKTVTVVFSDVANSTRLGERLDPEAHRRVMGRYFEAMQRVLERHGGTVEKFIGDAVMAVFGVPVLHEDDALRAVRAVVEMREALAEVNRELLRDWDLEIAIRTGVNTGEVVTGEPGATQTLVTGDAVVVAKRLEETAQASEIQLGESTFRLVSEAVLAEPVGMVEAKGKPAILAWRLLAVRPGAEVTPVRLDSPLVGRTLDLAALQEMFELVTAERSCRLVTVLGPAGIGKSRLIHELVLWLGDGALVLRGRCLPYGEGITFWPLVEVVRQAAGLTDRDSSEEARQKIGKLLPADDESQIISQRVAAAVGRGEAASARPEETFWAVRRLLEAIAVNRPIVVVFDDIQWAESTFLDLVEYVAGWSTNAPILICCLARPELLELRPSWGQPRPNAVAVLLQPLRERETEELLSNLLGRLPVAGDAQARIAGAAEGNPLFVEELLRMLRDEGVLRRENGGWRLAADLGKFAMPPTIQALLAARLDRLDPDERAAIQRASVAGQVFWWGAVAELTPERDRAGVGGRLQALVRKELIRHESSTFAAEDAFRFGHILIRDAAYAALPKGSRAELHERLADWLERKTQDLGEEYEEILGYHLEQAFDYRSQLGPSDQRALALAARAAERLASAGGRALRRGDVPAAVNLLERANTLPSSDGERRSHLLIDLGTALRETGQLARADVLLSEAIAAAEQRKHSTLAERARVEQAALRAYLGRDVEAVIGVAASAIATFEEAGDDLGCAVAWRHAASVHWSRCRLAAMQEALERALVHAERAGDSREVAAILDGLCRVAFAGPTPVQEGIRRCRDALDREDLTLKAVAEAILGGLVAMEGRFDEARELVAHAGRAFEDLGLSLKLAGVAMYGGYVELLAGEPAAAERELRKGYEALHAMGERGQLGSIAALLGRALFEQARLAEATRYIAASEEAAPADDVLSQVVLRATRARVLVRQGASEEAERLAREAFGIAEETDALNVRGDAACDLADVLILAGDGREAARVLEQAVQLYEAKGNVVAAGKARRSLAKLDFQRAKR